MAESISNFIRRVEDRTGLSISRIPNGVDSNMMDGAIIARSQHGCLVYLDCYGQDEETGVDLYERYVLIRWSDHLPSADDVFVNEVCDYCGEGFCDCGAFCSTDCHCCHDCAECVCV